MKFIVLIGPEGSILLILRYLPECSVPSERFDQDGLTSLHFLIGDSGLGFLPFGICWRPLLHALSASRFADGYLATGGTINTLATLPADVAAEGCPRCGLNYAYLWRHPRIRERRRHTQCGFCGMTYFDELMAILIGDDTVCFDVLFSRGASDPVSLFGSLGMPLEPYGVCRPGWSVPSHACGEGGISAPSWMKSV